MYVYKPYIHYLKTRYTNGRYSSKGRKINISTMIKDKFHRRVKNVVDLLINTSQMHEFQTRMKCE